MHATFVSTAMSVRLRTWAGNRASSVRRPTAASLRRSFKFRKREEEQEEEVEGEEEEDSKDGKAKEAAEKLNSKTGNGLRKLKYINVLLKYRLKKDEEDQASSSLICFRDRKKPKTATSSSSPSSGNKKKTKRSLKSRCAIS